MRQQIAATWEARTGANFWGWDTCTDESTGIHIHIVDAHPRVIGGLGRDEYGQSVMVLNFTFANWGPACRDNPERCIRGIAVHEFGHALGFAHEHNRDDRAIDCTQDAQGSNGDDKATKYDALSIMNYCNPRSYDGGLSDLDIVGAQKYYGKPTNNDCRLLESREYLLPGDRVDSCDGFSSLVFEDNGNVVRYGHDGRQKWSTNTSGSSASLFHMQRDGNLVLYDIDGKELWKSNTQGHAGAYLAAQNDDNLVVYDASGTARWSSRTRMPKPPGCGTFNTFHVLERGESFASCNGRLVLSMLENGNLMLVQDGVHQVWQSGTADRGAYMTTILPDGTFVVYGRDDRPLFSAPTGVPASRLVLQDDSTMVIYGPDGARLWQVGSSGAVTRNHTLEAMFADYGDKAKCDEWSGGDATNSVALPNGERAWFFSDSFLNSPAERKGLWHASFIHNAILIQGSNGRLRGTITGGNTCQEKNELIDFWSRYAKTPAASTVPGGFYWTGDQMLVGSNIVKFYYHGTGTLDAFTIDSPAVATLPVSAVVNSKVMDIVPTRFSCGASNIIWGGALLNWRGDVYVYGWRQAGLHQNIYLAKTSTANLTNPGSWKLYAGMRGSQPVWANCTGSAAALPITNGTPGFSVSSINNRLWLVQFDYTNGQLNAAGTIGAHPSATPWGFTNASVALIKPLTGNVTYPYYWQQYEARVQPGLGDQGHIVIAYNVNTFSVNTGCVSANNHDATIYRPRFINVPISKFTAAAAVDLPAPAPAPAPLTGPPAAPEMQAASTGIGGVTDWYFKGMGVSCPRVPAPSKPSLSFDDDGIVTATWSKVGTDVWYYPYVCDETDYDCSTPGTSHPWHPAWPVLRGGHLWSTGANGTYGLIDPIGLTTSPGRSTSGHEFAVYIRSFGAGNANGGGSSPIARITVTR